ncbi:putative Zn finger protein [Kitasatospora sp. GAS204A]|uniref:hypothetical protein n=1 Tax=unclassified Kitasatospora TaxID=2633591 RepID=UPI0024767991|nr:hypothetical protein [Kitasatospora sp. GAS204B]MDH6116879.1 putative Zn finger protein [Kitasatospora sp. GAS204B]
MSSTARILCAHGYVLMQDSCPGCDSAEETPHPADPVKVRPSWSSRTLTRCRTCGKTPGHQIHKTA